MKIQNLPQELLLQVFLNLNFRDTSSVLKVCRLWNTIADDNQNWKRLYEQTWSYDNTIILDSENWKKRFKKRFLTHNNFLNNHYQCNWSKNYQIDIKKLKIRGNTLFLEGTTINKALNLKNKKNIICKVPWNQILDVTDFVTLGLTSDTKKVIWSNRSEFREWLIPTETKLVKGKIVNEKWLIIVLVNHNDEFSFKKIDLVTNKAHNIGEKTNDLHFGCNEKLLVSRSGDKSLSIWEIQSGRKIDHFEFEFIVNHFEVCDEWLIVTAGNELTIKVMESGETIWSTFKTNYRISHKRLLLYNQNDLSLRVINLKNLKLEGEINLNYSIDNYVYAENNIVFNYENEGILYLWDLKDNIKEFASWNTVAYNEEFDGTNYFHLINLPTDVRAIEYENGYLSAVTENGFLNVWDYNNYNRELSLLEMIKNIFCF